MDKNIFFIWNKKIWDEKYDCKTIQNTISKLEKFGTVENLITQKPKDAITLTYNAIRNKSADIIISVGGDGTINEVINGIMQANNQRVLFGVIPCGSSNDFIKSFGKHDLVKSIVNQSFKFIDVGKIIFKNSEIVQYFLNIADIGLGAMTVKRTKRFFISSRITYIFNSIITMLSFDYQNIRVVLDGQEYYNGAITAVIAANGNYFGSGLAIAPNAKIDDGLLDVVLVKKISILKFIRSLPRMRKREILPYKEIEYLNAKSIELIPLYDKIYPVEADGEYLGNIPVKIEILPRVLRILY